MDVYTSTLNELAERLRESDEAAFVEIYDLVREPVMRHVARIIDDEDGAYDVVQDVFMKLWETRSSLQIEVSFKALIYTMARNRAINLKQKSARSSPDLGVTDGSDGQVDGQSPEHDFVANELAKRIHRWVDELPPRRREAFELSRFHGLKHKEISEIMGLSLRTVEAHILDALRELRVKYDALETYSIEQ